MASPRGRKYWVRCGFRALRDFRSVNREIVDREIESPASQGGVKPVVRHSAIVFRTRNKSEYSFDKVT